MIKNRKNSVSALALCLVSYSFLASPSFGVGGKRTFDAIDTGDTEDRPTRRARLGVQEEQEEDSYRGLYSSIFTTAMAQLQQAERDDNQTLQKSAMRELKIVADKENYPEASYIYGRFIQQDPSNSQINLNSAISYFEKAEHDAELSVRACYHKGICYKQLGQIDNAIASFEQIAEQHPPSQAQYGILLYDKSKSSTDVSIKSLTNKKAFDELTKVSNKDAEAAYKLGIIYSEDDILKNLNESQKMFVLAENMFQTEPKKNSYGIYTISPSEAECNIFKKKNSAYRIAEIKWNLLQEEGRENLYEYLQINREEIQDIKYFLKKATENSENDTKVEDLNNSIDKYLPWQTYLPFVGSRWDWNKS